MTLTTMEIKIVAKLDTDKHANDTELLNSLYHDVIDRLEHWKDWFDIEYEIEVVGGIKK